ncbi:MAG: HD domain-containing protein [Lachnospiraceae bacterium]|nr:HD domain-containing protein [Lachnospiraceae bacterium]
MRKELISKAQRRYNKQKELHRKLKEHAEDILVSEKFQSTRAHVQHGSIPVHRHCIDVAKQSLLICKYLHLPVREKEMVRGALLHDYFLYDWHDRERVDYREQHGSLHGFYHPGIALKNASRDYDLTPREADIIKKHMWPMTVIPPKCTEAWVVTFADKYCSLLETLKLRKGAAGTRPEKSERKLRRKITKKMNRSRSA